MIGRIRVEPRAERTRPFLGEMRFLRSPLTIFEKWRLTIMEIKVTLQNGTIREVLQGTTIKEAAGAISTSLKKML